MPSVRFISDPLRHHALQRWVCWILACFCACTLGGCSLFPDIRHKPQYHNPFPQLTRLAILPFRNQSQEPTLSGERVTAAYYAELQSIPGFEILPVGVVENQWLAFESQILRRPAATSEDFQRFAQYLGVDAVLQGAVTDYTPYYPPRMTLKVNWYAANPGFHPIPAGYGLPWGTKDEKKIPQWVRLEAERSLAREQLKSQTPNTQEENTREIPDEPSEPEEVDATEDSQVRTMAFREPKRRSLLIGHAEHQPESGDSDTVASDTVASDAPASDTVASDASNAQGVAQALPDDWPDPQGFIPHPPRPEKPAFQPQYEPVISHMRAYNGSDEDFTNALEDYFYFRDDARFGGWQAYLQRSEDFIRFCCHRHVVETLGARGGQLENRLILRWPIGRYER